MSAVSPPIDGVLTETGFWRFWSARVLSNASFQIAGVVIGWQIYALTNSAFALGLVGLSQFLPMLLLTLPAGHIADRYDRRLVVGICQWLVAATAAGLAAASFFGVLTPGLVFAAAAMVGACRTFENPAMTALLPALVGPALLPRALALSASAMQTATILGPALGGAIYLAGPDAAYALVALFYTAASLLVRSLRPPEAPARQSGRNLADLLSGFAFIRAKPVVLGAISLDMVAVLLGGATALLPIYAHDILQTNSIGLGVLRAAPAVGALRTSLFLARRPLKRNVGAKIPPDGPGQCDGICDARSRTCPMIRQCIKSRLWKMGRPGKYSNVEATR